MSVRVAVLASGGGTNLQALLDHLHEGSDAAARVSLVISDRADAGALQRAERAGVASLVIPVRGRAEEEVAEETLTALEEAGIGLVALAGYLRLIPAAVVRRYGGRMLNVHPALLPAFGGKGMYGERVHRAVLDAGCRVTGVTVHFVDEEYDRGAILAQWPVPVLAGDTPETLGQRVLRVEHRLYPLALQSLAARLAANGLAGPPEGRGNAAAPAATSSSDTLYFDLEEGLAPRDRTVRALLGDR